MLERKFLRYIVFLNVFLNLKFEIRMNQGGSFNVDIEYLNMLCFNKVSKWCVCEEVNYDMKDKFKCINFKKLNIIGY